MVNEIKIYTLGGSIDKSYSMDESDFIVAEPGVGNILREANISHKVEIVEFFRKDSLEITEAERKDLLSIIKKDPCRHILITHGTDTMHLTGKALSEIKDKVIVITGAMRPAAFRDTDAHFNLGGALVALQTLSEGVYIVMNGRIFDPFRMNKNMETGRMERKSE